MVTRNKMDDCFRCCFLDFIQEPVPLGNVVLERVFGLRHEPKRMVRGEEPAALDDVAIENDLVRVPLLQVDQERIHRVHVHD